MLGLDHHGSPTLGCTAAQARNPDGVAHTQTLGRHNYLQPPEYILITNFDFFFHDVRELFDPTGSSALAPATASFASAAAILAASAAASAAASTSATATATPSTQPAAAYAASASAASANTGSSAVAHTCKGASA